MAVSLFAPGFLFLLAATALLVVVSVSTPVWRDVYFLEIGLSSSLTSSVSSILPDSLSNDIDNKLKLGIWGYCLGSTCSAKQVGYKIPKAIVGGRTGDVIGDATGALVLHPIAAGISLIALLFALCGNVVTGLFAAIVAFFAFFVALIALIVDLCLFVIAKHRVDDIDDTSTSYGNALWMTLAATILLLLASFTVCCAHHRSRRARGYDNSPSNAPMTQWRRPFWRRQRDQYA